MSTTPVPHPHDVTEPPVYPRGTVRALLDTDHVTPATRAALRARLADDPGAAAPRALDADAYAVLRAACARLVPQPDRGTPDGDPPVDVAAMIDARLADGPGDGWRYAVLPADAEAYRRGLAALDAHARATFGAPFAALDGAARDAALGAAQRGAVGDDPLGVPGWAGGPAARWFEELLAEACECYYSHPLAQEEIGYAGMADVPAWRALGLDVVDPREPRPVEPRPLGAAARG
ncbi:hypothetical protein tb265_43100 [Gemmatimonadetes bacterium T265]|nr:hypothetical protein tb265_43100 [Gemmatimonadetes bacterium T265]